MSGVPSNEPPRPSERSFALKAAIFAENIAAGLRTSPATTFKILLQPRAWGHVLSHKFSLRVHGRKFLDDFYAAAREAKVRPFLMWGTLLGSIRDNGFIARDTDIDIGILSSDYSRKDALIAAMVHRGYQLAFDVPYKFRFMRKDRLHLDVDVLHRIGEEAICSKVADDEWRGARFPLRHFTRLEPHRFGGDLDVLVPDDAETLLAFIYGSWRVPNPSYSSKTPRNEYVFRDGGASPPFLEISES